MGTTATAEARRWRLERAYAREGDRLVDRGHLAVRAGEAVVATVWCGAGGSASRDDAALVAAAPGLAREVARLHAALARVRELVGRKGDDPHTLLDEIDAATLDWEAP